MLSTLSTGGKVPADHGGDEFLAVGVPEVNGRALGPDDLAGAGDDDAQQVLAVDVLGEGLAEVVEESRR